MGSSAGTVASLHLHPEQGGKAFTEVEGFEVVAEKGIAGNPRYFGRTNRFGKPSRRQVTLIEREQITEHASALGVKEFAPGAVRSNIETNGIDLRAVVGHHIKVGGAVLFVYESREPCGKMDAIHPGLQMLMKNGKQGVVAQVTKGGFIKRGDPVLLIDDKRTAAGL